MAEARHIGLPLRLTHVYSSAPWGGEWIRKVFARADAPAICSESWEVSGHPYGMSVVAEGPFATRTLADLAQEFGAALTGSRSPDPHRFPLLIKLLDARRSLSVQVHPTASNAAETGGEPKVEAWLILEASPGAALYAGVQPGTTEESFRDAVEQGEALVGVLARHAVLKGDVFYIPGGVVHAIGAGCLIFEVQQSSNTTYRFYDWDRVDAAGKGRALHIEQAFKSLDFRFPPVRAHRSSEAVKVGKNIFRTRLHTPVFTVKELELNEPMTLPLDGSSFVACFALAGEVAVSSGGATVEVPFGSSVLVPADAKESALSPRGASARLLMTTL